MALRRIGSASIAPAHAIIQVLDALRGALAGAIPLTVRVHGEYGIDDAFVGVPVRLTPDGVSEVCVLPLASGELAALRHAGATTSARADRGQ